MLLASCQLFQIRRLAMHDLMFAAVAVALTAAVAVTLPARDDRLPEGLDDSPDCSWRVSSAGGTADCAR